MADDIDGESKSPDAHGQAAMLLVESLIHALFSRSVITVTEAIEIIDVAAEVKEDMGTEKVESRETMEKSLVILRSISASLGWDNNTETETVA